MPWLKILLSLSLLLMSCFAFAESEDSQTVPLSEQLNSYAQIFASDVQRQISTDIIPVQVGQMALSALVSPSLTRQNRGVILFIADGQTNGSRLTLYRTMAQAFQKDGFTSLVTILPYPEQPLNNYQDAQATWQPALSAIHNQLNQYQAPIQLIVAHGQVGASLLYLYQEGLLSGPTGLVLDNVFFGTAQSNQAIPQMIAQQSVPILDFAGRTNHNLSRITEEKRAFAGSHRGGKHYRQRQLLGMGMDRKQALFLQKEIKGFLKNLGWI